MTVLRHSFESGQASGTTITTGNSGVGGDAFDTTTIGTGTGLTYNSTALRQTLSMLATTGATAAAVSANWTTKVGSMSHVYVRFLFRRGSTAAVTQVMCRVRGAGVQNFRITLDTDNTVTLRNSASSFLIRSVGTTDTTNTWMLRADITIGASATGILYVHYDPLVATPDETLTVNNANFGTNNANEVNWGLAIATASATMRLDDIAMSNVSLPGPPAQLLGQAVELNSAQSIARAKSRTLVQASETDVGQAISRRKARTLSQCVESNVSQPITRRKSRSIGQTVETSISQSVMRRKSRTLAQGVELNGAQSLTRRKNRTLALAIEGDTSQALTRRKTRSVSQAIENSSAQAIGRLKSRQLALAVELSTSQTFSYAKRRTLAQAVETDLALVIARLKIRSLGLAIETDLALPLGQVTIVQLGIAIEDSSALPLMFRKSRTLGQALEQGLALPLDTTQIIVPLVAGVQFNGLTADWILVAARSRLSVEREGRTVAESLTADELAERLRTYD